MTVLYAGAAPLEVEGVGQINFVVPATPPTCWPDQHSMMNGPMLKVLLEERFKLKIHRETKEIPVHELTVAKDGLKAPRFAAGSCTPFDWNIPLPDQLQKPDAKALY